MLRVPTWAIFVSGFLLTVASITPTFLIDNVELRTRTIDGAILVAINLIVVAILTVSCARPAGGPLWNPAVVLPGTIAVSLLSHDLRTIGLTSWQQTLMRSGLIAIGHIALLAIFVLLIIGLNMFLASRLGEWHDRRYPTVLPDCAGCVSTESAS